MLIKSFREQEFDAKHNLVIWPEVGLLDVGVTDQLEVDRHLAETVEFADPSSDGDFPAVVAVGLPIRSDGRCAGEIPAWAVTLSSIDIELLYRAAG